MSDALSLDPKTSALLVMDYQVSILESLPDHEALLARTAKLLAAARAAKALVVYVVVAFRRGYPEVSAKNASFAAIRGSGRLIADDPKSQVHATLAPTGDEAVVTKHRVGAFLGTDLEMILRAHGIETLIFSGIATSGVVLSTLRHAADADFRIVVAADCCADRDPEVHQVLTEKVFPRQGTVTTSDAVIAALGG